MPYITDETELLVKPINWCPGLCPGCLIYSQHTVFERGSHVGQVDLKLGSWALP